jgi:hypothetical protein
MERGGPFGGPPSHQGQKYTVMETRLNSMPLTRKACAIGPANAFLLPLFTAVLANGTGGTRRRG